MARKKQKKSEGKSKFPFLLLLMMSLTISAIAFAGYMWFEHQKVKDTLMNTASETVARPAVVSPEPIYFPLEAFTISLKPSVPGSPKILYIGLTLKLANETSKQNIEKFLPEIRSRLLMLFSHQEPGDLLNDEGKQRLMSEIKDAINKSLNGQDSIQITDVLFNAFILR
ncbi:flagellar basal body-associated protein FliL [Morganella morganii]|uniref:flagellar basal body-associated protein FliL n=1 Tax=Morganella morganii TaxID=582 RepID=UPI0021CF9E0E|nr:flagellar basal body-associated protein FliL [Morganella morganii]MCU6377233.1 flagellar basal body-associated protein FliL [Morganella morganii]